jgi:hypothetical protein
LAEIVDNDTVNSSENEVFEIGEIL